MDFLRNGIWKIDLGKYSPVKAWPLRILRIIIMAAVRFQKDDCQRSASVLTYYSLLNIVPLFAVLFAIAKGFGLEKLIVRQIVQVGIDLNWQADITANIIEFSRSLLANARGEVIVGFGVVILFWTVISILSRIEDSFNTIWEARQSRTIVRKFTDYLSMIVLAPILFALWSSVNVLIAGEAKGFISDIAFLGGPVLFLLRLLPYVSVCVLLIILFLVMPNTRISFRSAAVAAIVSGVLIQIVQWAYIKFQIGVAAQSAIYGSFAAIPLFLAYLQISWLIVLFGAETANAVENYETYGFRPDFSRIGVAGRRLIMLNIFHLLAKRFEKGQTPLTSRQISKELAVPDHFVKHILLNLVDVDLVSEITRGPRQQSTYQPARPISDTTIKDAIDAYEKAAQVGGLPIDQDDAIAVSLRTLFEKMDRSSANVKIKDI
ncbi:MAG: rane spanning protein ribonuclease BN-like family [Deltaproteobacteria bacterium]|nr:rane spanning protein ribonuclease BN-like family [Deltaproteobacteria bacterium]